MVTSRKEGDAGNFTLHITSDAKNIILHKEGDTEKVTLHTEGDADNVIFSDAVSPSSDKINTAKIFKMKKTVQNRTKAACSRPDRFLYKTVFQHKLWK